LAFAAAGFDAAGGGVDGTGACAAFAAFADSLPGRERSHAAYSTDLHDAGVAAVPAEVAGSDLVEQLDHRAAVAHHPAGHAHGVDDPALLLVTARVGVLGEHVAQATGPGDGPLRQPSGLLGLGVGGLDALVGEERGHQVGEQRLPVRRRPRKMQSSPLMSHGSSSESWR
jgi:hypothetical protein